MEYPNCATKAAGYCVPAVVLSAFGVCAAFGHSSAMAVVAISVLIADFSLCAGPGHSHVDHGWDRYGALDDILLSPMISGIVMAFSSVSVISNALRLRKFTV